MFNIIARLVPLIKLQISLIEALKNFHYTIKPVTHIHFRDHLLELCNTVKDRVVVRVSEYRVTGREVNSNQGRHRFQLLTGHSYKILIDTSVSLDIFKVSRLTVIHTHVIDKLLSLFYDLRIIGDDESECSFKVAGIIRKESKASVHGRISRFSLQQLFLQLIIIKCILYVTLRNVSWIAGRECKRDGGWELPTEGGGEGFFVKFDSILCGRIRENFFTAKVHRSFVELYGAHC
jgi:hypothetical protein